jgi:hypothetical protein
MGQAILDAKGAAVELLNALQPGLLAAGWSIFEMPRPVHGGFVSGVSGAVREFRRGEQGPILMATVVDREAESADVRLRLDWELPRHMPRPPHGLPPGGDLMPARYRPQ